jgi:hypothetical protein
MPSACTAVILRRFSKSDMWAVSCASWAWRWESWRDLDADVGTVDRRVWAALAVRVGFDILSNGSMPSDGRERLLPGRLFACAFAWMEGKNVFLCSQVC